MAERMWRVTRAEGAGEQVEEDIGATDWNQTVEEPECPEREFLRDLGESGRHRRLWKREMPCSDLPLFRAGGTIGGRLVSMREDGDKGCGDGGRKFQGSDQSR